jgi:peptidoglycan hydrolase-like protein with peptidoglycan-binding domain
MRNMALKVVAAVFVLVFVVVAAGPTFAAGTSVKAIQSALNKHGYHVKADGKMGPQTESALMKFQQANGLSVTGKPDAPTAAKLGVK